MSKEFKRQDISRYSKLGKNRKKLQKWRKPKGRHSKMRWKRFSYPATPTVGHKTPKTEAGKVSGVSPVLVYNISDVKNVKSGSGAIIAKVGKKKKLEIIKAAQEAKIKLLNVQEDKK